MVDSFLQILPLYPSTKKAFTLGLGHGKAFPALAEHPGTKLVTWSKSQSLPVSIALK